MQTVVDSPTDQELLKRYVCGGDEGAFAALVGRHIDAICAAARRQVRDGHLAEEVSQAVLVVLARRAPTLGREGSLAGWLMKVTWLTARGALRVEQRRALRERQVQAMNGEKDAGMEGAAAWRDMAPVVDEAMTRLSDAERGAIVLRFLEDREISEVARILGIQEAAAKKRVSRALVKLRGFLARRGVSIPDATLSSALVVSATEPAPPQLLATGAHQALAAAKAPLGVGSGTVGILAKGTLVAMTLSKVKVAVAVVCLLAIPSAYVAMQFSGETVQEKVAAGATRDFSSVYGLDEGQVLKRVANAPADVRGAYMQKVYSRPVGVFFVGWRNHRPWANRTFGQGDGYRVLDLAKMAREPALSSLEVEGDAELLNHPLTGDIAYNAGVVGDAYCDALSGLLHEAFGIEAKIAFREAPRKVVVLHGQWTFVPGATGDGVDGAEPVLQLYSEGPADEQFTRAAGDEDRRSFAASVGALLGEQVVIAARGLPEQIRWRAYGKSDDELRTNRERVLQHLADQTGLTWSEEVRSVRRLFVEKK